MNMQEWAKAERALIEHGRTRYEKLVAAGLCWRCKKPKHPESTSSCLDCLKKDRAKNRKQYGHTARSVSKMGRKTVEELSAKRVEVLAGK